MKREYFTPSNSSHVCAELFIEDSFEQNLTVRSLFGLSFKLCRLNCIQKSRGTDDF